MAYLFPQSPAQLTSLSINLWILFPCLLSRAVLGNAACPSCSPPDRGQNINESWFLLTQKFSKARDLVCPEFEWHLPIVAIYLNSFVQLLCCVWKVLFHWNYLTCLAFIIYPSPLPWRSLNLFGEVCYILFI